jgi:hypothetical protein
LQREAATALLPYAKSGGQVVFDAPAHIVSAQKAA